MKIYCLMEYFTIILLNQFYFTLAINAKEYVNEYVVQCSGGYSEAKNVALQMGFILKHKMRGFDDFYVFKYKYDNTENSNFHRHRLKRSVKVNWVEQQYKLTRVKRDFKKIDQIKFFDPLFKKQWYLIRSQFNPKLVDMNVKEAWELGYTGKGVTISILDDGIDYRHDDLKENYDPKASFDINGDDNDPLPNLKVIENRHGTRCAGEVSAKANNSKCGVGIAYNSRIGAVRMLDGDVTDRVEAEALSFKQQHIDIYSGSWGPDDNGQKVEGPAILARSAFKKGIRYGRNGLGNIYVWASGNGGKKSDSCACDGYASSIYTISISSVSENNRKPWYLESCASTLASTYSSGDGNEQKIISTDLNNKCAFDHTGTSASAPLAAGIIALLIEANSNLTWRDVQYITVLTSNPTPFIDGEFIVNGANRKVSNLYGFGLMDSGKLVRLGRLWYNLPSQHFCKISYNGTKIILKDKFTVKLSVKTDGCSGKNKVNYVEHVILHLKLDYDRRGDLRINLISPSGTRSEILPYRPFDFSKGPTTFDIWPLMSVQFWGEKASGEWIVEIDNGGTKFSNYHGVWSKFELKIYGTEKWPIRLKSAEFSKNNKWFQQFERMVVESTRDTDQKHSRASYRGHSDFSHVEFTIGDFDCDEECFNNTCSAPGPQFCDLCANYQTMNGICVSKCNSGTYADNSSKICHKCHFSCDECIGPDQFNCSRCLTGDYYDVDKKQCQLSLQNCSRGYVKESNKCVKCPENCSICSSSSQCSDCLQSFVLTLQNRCVSKCDIGSYPDSRKRCRVCHFDCLSCINGDASGCTSCSHGSFINPVINSYEIGYCVKKCPFGYFTNHTVGFCYRCHENCKSCNGPSPEMCTSCLPPLELSEAGKSCIDPVSKNCKPDEFKSITGNCEKCLSGCQTCSKDACTSCKTDEYIHQKMCVNQCPIGYFNSSRLNLCLPCSEFCNFCNSSTTFRECSGCSNNNALCDRNCTIGWFWNNFTDSCQKCHLTCHMCNGATDQDCTICAQKSESLSAGRCLKRCPVKEYSMSFTYQNMCIPCHSSCENFSCNSITGRCLSCPHGHRLHSSGICQRIITCAIAEFWHSDQHKCVKCDSSCRSCHQNGTCTSCYRNFCLNPRRATCNRCCKVSSMNRNCSQCKIGRELCLIEESINIPTLIIFRHPIQTILLTIASFILMYMLIILYFYSANVVQFFNRNHYIPDSKLLVRYRKLENLNDDEICEDLDSSDDNSQFSDKVQYLNLPKSLDRSVTLETINERNNCDPIN